ncbi:serine hydrolase [Tautonia sociabilis]|uniref:Class C beta-lactamase-related serine hydrolase n=1 Tax=Tautonia sociabilis TaxID=2080755 RepID=A0A432MJN4_9BACT|nr:serine hydrolase [Tautonia sociabilis]RUL87623.1 class C beta-lactamase-related serine hydrolase [Tautonia sociabilis]
MIAAIAPLIVALLVGPDADAEVVFPGEGWEHRDPAELGLDPEALDRFAEELGGRGCVVRNGYVVKQWGDQSERSDWYSSVKPLFSTLLFFAIEEGRVSGVDQPVAEFGWDLQGNDRAITFRHLADMTSGYARPEPPGAAWAYNDFAIQLYQQTLFDRVFRGEPGEVVCDPARLGPLGFQDGLEFNGRRRLIASVRDFARLDWFWLNRGRWGDRQLLPSRFFDDFMTPDVPADLPQTAKAETEDPLGLGTFGGGSDHFTEFGPGIYGFNWWFNASGRTHPGTRTWPDAPPDAVMTIGFGGNCSVILPGDRIVVASARGDWGRLEAGQAESTMNRRLSSLMRAIEPGRD